MYNNNLFNSSYSTSNPFNGMTPNSVTGGNNSFSSPALAEAYAKLEALKQQNVTNQSIPQSTVYTDIANEFKDVGEDELNFIASSPEYQTLNNQYQTEFSEFLTAKFANEYLQTSGKQRTLEELLLVIRKRKDKYKERFAEDINDIREQNKTLLDRNNELADNNEKLQQQLQEIQKKLNKTFRE